MTTFVLVHGAWSGAHSFRKVRPLLQARGHAVFTPSLTGLGERSHLVSPQVNLSTHVQDVTNQILYEDLTDIVLLGHSYGGAVVTGCLDHVGDRVRHLVYLDAFVPADGQALVDVLGVDRRPSTGLQGDWLLPAAVREYDDPAETAWALPRRRPHPAACFAEPVRLSRPLAGHPFSLTYVRATQDPPAEPGSIASLADAAFARAADAARADPRWRYREVATNHMVQHNAPDRLAALLLEVGAP